MRDQRAIPDYIDKFPDKTLILEFENELPEHFSWDILPTYAEKLNGNFYCATSNFDQITECKSRGLKFYYKYPVTSFYELNALHSLEASYILVGIPLIFDLDNVSRYKIPLRAIPNLAYEPYLPHKDGICGGWIRPEDTEAYGKYIDVFEFYAPKSLDKESTLYHIYAENGKWPGNLNILIDGFGVDANNQMIYDEENFANRRMNCRQRCVQTGSCHYCVEQIKFMDTINKYRKQKSKN